MVNNLVNIQCTPCSNNKKNTLLIRLTNSDMDKNLFVDPNWYCTAPPDTSNLI